MSGPHQVVWPYATVKLIDAATGQSTVRGFAEGSVLPPNADAEDVRRLVAKGAVVSTAPTRPSPEPTTAPETPALDPGQDPGETGRPKDYASKPEWVDYAVSKRADDVSEEDARAVAELTSKADLIAEFG